MKPSIKLINVLVLRNDYQDRNSKINAIKNMEIIEENFELECEELKA